MEQERQQQQDETAGSKSRHKPAEYISHLALQRGAQRRGDTAGPDFRTGAAAAILLSHKPDFRYFHENDPEELADHLHWFDELAGCVLAAYILLDCGNVDSCHLIAGHLVWHCCQD